MNRDNQLKTLKSPKATKEQLREALAAALGVTYERQSKEKETTLFAQCRDTFLEAYKEHTGLDYSFMPIDGRSLSQLIEKVKSIVEHPTDETVIATFRLFILKLPDWYKQNQFSIKVINNKFNEIVASIRKNGEQGGITNSYKDNLINRMRARSAGSQSTTSKDS